MKQLLIEYFPLVLTPQQLKEGLDKGGTLYVEAILQRANSKNQNGRIYSREILEREIENYIKTSIAENRALGELDHCLDPESQILTSSGWKYLKDVSDNEEVYTLSENNDIEKEVINKKIANHYEGKMYHFTSKNNIDIMCSPKHRFFLWDRYGKKHIRTAQEVYKLYQEKSSWLSHCHIKTSGAVRENKNISAFKIPGTEYEVNMELWLAFLGIWLAEGSASGTKGGNRKKKEVIIHQKKEPQVSKIRELLFKLPFSFKEYDCDGKIEFRIKHEGLYNYFYSLGNSKTKYIPEEFFECDISHLSTMMDWMLLGDGRNRKKPGGGIIKELATISPQLSRDAEHIFFLMGNSSFVTKRPIGYKGGFIKSKEVIAKHELNIICENKTNIHLDVRYLNIEEVDYSGMIYCVSTKNGNFYTKRKGRSHWTGNSETAVINLKNSCLNVKKVWWDGDTVKGKIEILNTPSGKILQELIKAGVTVGISSRGMGSVDQVDEGTLKVGEDFSLLCWDAVSTPSTHQAFMKPINLQEGYIPDLNDKYHRVNEIILDMLCIKSGFCSCQLKK